MENWLDRRPRSRFAPSSLPLRVGISTTINDDEPDFTAGAYKSVARGVGRLLVGGVERSSSEDAFKGVGAEERDTLVAVVDFLGLPDRLAGAGTSSTKDDEVELVMLSASNDFLGRPLGFLEVTESPASEPTTSESFG
jgi:hypothetical protein